jgi:hypothetical protein
MPSSMQLLQSPDQGLARYSSTLNDIHTVYNCTTADNKPHNRGYTTYALPGQSYNAAQSSRVAPCCHYMSHRYTITAPPVIFVSLFSVSASTTSACPLSECHSAVAKCVHYYPCCIALCCTGTTAAAAATTAPMSHQHGYSTPTHAAHCLLVNAANRHTLSSHHSASTTNTNGLAAAAAVTAVHCHPNPLLLQCQHLCKDTAAQVKLAAAAAAAAAAARQSNRIC